MDALNARKSTRSFADKSVEPQILADMLWAAFGVNRHDGKRTAPTAMNKQDMDIYVLNKDGVFLYDAKENALLPVSDKDLRNINTQPFAKKAPVTLLYVAQNGRCAGMHAGSLYQNVGLFCAAFGLNNVVRGGKDDEAKFFIPMQGDMVAIVGENRKLLLFDLVEIPEMTKGQGVFLQKYQDGCGVSDIKLFNKAGGLSYPCGNGTRIETNLIGWLGHRAQVGKLPPVGFPKGNHF